MALFKIFKGNDINRLNNPNDPNYRIPIDGYAYYNTDNQEFYIDTYYRPTNSQIENNDSRIITNENDSNYGLLLDRRPINAHYAYSAGYDGASSPQKIHKTYIKNLEIKNNQLSYTTGDGVSHSVEGTLGAVTGVKGNAEATYRTGQVNLTPAKIGAATDNHQHPLSLATSSETSNITLAYNNKYKLTAGENSLIFTTPSNETNLLVRPKQLNGTNDPTIQTLINDNRANRLAFLPADQIIIEKTTDGGNTWVDAQISDDVKTGLFSQTRPGIYIPLLNGEKNILCGLRITITGMKYNVPEGTPETSKYEYWNSTYVNRQERYNQIKEMYFYVSSNSDSIKVKVERATGGNSNNWITIFENNNYGMTGWSGNDYISFPQGVFGGGTNQVNNYWNYRITLFTAGPNGSSTLSGTNKTSTQSISEIRAYGDTWWGLGSNLAAKDHLYSWDYLQNAIFPAKVISTSFEGPLHGNADSATNVAWSGITNKPTTLSGYGITDAKIENGTIILGNNTITPLTTHQSLSNYKTKQTTVSSATAETTTATTFVYSVTQNENGVISVKTRPLPTYNNYTLPTATTSIKGGVVIGDNINVDTNGKISIDSASVIAALDYTPYDSSNPNGYTNNIGTITGIKMNGVSKGTSGIVDLGTVITDVSGKLDTLGGTITGNLTVGGTLTLSGNPTSNLHAATKQYVDNAFTTNDALVFKGTLGASNDGATVTSLPNTHKQGWTYKVVTAGTYAGQECEIGDTIYCITDGTTANNDHWTIVQTNIDGYVIGPATSTTNGIATYSGATGRGLSDSGKTITTSTPASGSNDTTIPTSKAVWSAITGAPGYGETGTVTSVAASGSNGITISGSPITSSGTITIGLNLSTAINGLGEGTSPANRNDYAVVQYAGGGTTTTTYHRRKLSNVFAALNSSDITDALGYTPYNATNPDGYTSNGGTVTKVSTGIGLTGGDITDSGTIKVNLNSETSLGTIGTTDKLYAVGVDASGELAVKVPWTNTNTWDANSKDVAGYVAAPGDVANKVWKTDANGNPAWRDDANTTYSSKAAASEGTAVSLVTTGEKYIWNNKSIVSISRDLTSGTKIGTITINGTDTDLYCETNTNTDTKVQQSVSSTEKWRKILLHNTQDNTSTTAVTDATDKVYAAVGVSVQPSTGTVRAGEYNIMDKVSLVFNSTTNALDFVFA